MENKINLSYLIVTKNKLPYLKDALRRILLEKKKDEEILIGDGGSTDGTKEYLEELKKLGKISVLISEPDKGIAHAFNKLTLAANGALTTFITDDDVYSYQEILKCKSFMLEHPDIDLLCSEGAIITKFTEDKNEQLKYVRPLLYTKNYREWQKNHKPFSFCDLGCIFRRSSLPLLGLHNPSFLAPDTEYSLRVTSSPAKIAWYTGYTYVNISNPQSTSLTYMKKIKKDTDRLNKLYLDKNKDSFFLEKIKILRNKIKQNFLSKKAPIKKTFVSMWPEVVSTAEEWLTVKSNAEKSEFLF